MTARISRARGALACVAILAAAGCQGAPGAEGVAPTDQIEMVRSAVTSGATKINAGGPAASPYIADVDFSGGGTVTRNNTIDLSAAVNPAPAALYQSQRYGDFTYTLPGFVSGAYNQIRLHFCDTHWTTADTRLFNVAINGTTVLSNFDVIGTVGAGNKALIKTFTMPANASGQYVIAFTTVKDAATVSGIEITASPNSAGVDGLSEQGYVDFCRNSGVPIPPPWGQANIGTGSTKWTVAGSYTDTFLGPASGFNGTTYVNTQTSGVCMLNGHDSHNFDIICQNNTTGKACFWEGQQAKALVAGSVNLVPNGQWSFGQGDHAIHSAAYAGTPNDPAIAKCTSCHVGQNAFLGHNVASHPLNRISSWMSSTFMIPLVPSTWPPNPDPGTTAFNSFPKGVCLDCHSSNAGGRFPTLDVPLIESNYCTVLAEVTNRPASQGGMPPQINGKTNNCTPDYNCARQTDPFVQTMLKAACGGTVPGLPVARSLAGTPTVVYASSPAGPAYVGYWEHFIADNWSGSTHQTLFYNNKYTDHLTGWNLDRDLTSNFATPFTASPWVRSTSLDGNFVSVMATTYDGSISEQTLNSSVRKNINAQLAAGAPSAYLRNDQVNVAVYRGVDDNIHELVWNGSSWVDTTMPNPAGTTPYGDPIGYTNNYGTGSDGISEVVWACRVNTSTSICQARHVGTNAWISRSINPTAKIRDDGFGNLFMPMPNVTQWGHRSIAYIGVDGVHIIDDPSAPAFGATSDPGPINGDLTVTSSPSLYSDQDGNLNVVYGAKSGSTSSIVELHGTPSTGYTRNTLFSTTSETLRGSPTAYVTQPQWLNTILYRTSAHLYQSQWSKATNAYVRTTAF